MAFVAAASMTSRFLLVSLFCSALGVFAPAAGAAPERAETLRAINWVENPTNHTRRGAKGELGPYQFRAQTWRLHTRKPFNLAVVREHADEIAVKHYEFIKRGLAESGIDPTPFNIALAWNSGLGAVQRGRVPTVSYNYAERVSNLVEAQRGQKESAARNVAQAKPAESSGVPEAGVRFSLAGEGPRYSLAALPLRSPVEPVVSTREAEVTVADIPVIKVENSPFTIGAVASPRIALIP